MGLDESKFWDMTVAEIQRYMEGAVWRMRSQAQFDYTLANLIGVSTARIMSNGVEMPPIEQVYPNLFEEEKEESVIQAIEDKKMEDSKNRFLEFALQHNARLKRRVDDE